MFEIAGRAGGHSVQERVRVVVSDMVVMLPRESPLSKQMLGDTDQHILRLRVTCRTCNHDETLKRDATVGIINVTFPWPGST